MFRSDAQMAAHILAVLLRNDREPRVVGLQNSRKQWGFDRSRDYLRAIGAEIYARGGETALWEAMRQAVALLPNRRQEGLIRLVYAWAAAGDWLADQNLAKPGKPEGYRPPAA
jgi:hypothetical protein